MREIFENLATIVTGVGVELGLTLSVLNVMQSTDKDTKQIGYFVNATCEELLTRHPWRKIIGTSPWVYRLNTTWGYVLVDDTDTPQFDSRTIKQGTKWRYLQSKGLTYDEAFRSFEKRIYDFAYDYNHGQVVNTNDGSATTTLQV